MKNLKSKLIVVLIVMLGITAFVGCEKEADFISKTGNFDYKLKNSEFNIEDSIDRIGEIHNEILDELFVKFNWSSTNYVTELLFQANKLNIAKQIGQNYNINFFDDNCCLKVLMEKIDTLYSKDANILFDKVLNLIENYSYYDDFCYKLDSICNTRVCSQLNYDERIGFLTACSVWKHSAKYWLVPGENGYNLVREINSRASNKAKAIVAADGASAGGGMLSVAVVGICGGPVGWVGLVGVGIGAGISSAWAALTYKERICPFCGEPY